MSTPHMTDARYSQYTSIGQNQYVQSTIHNITNFSYPSQRESTLAALNPVDRAIYYVTPCMEGTRRWVMDAIRYWLDDVHAPNILWLKGRPGSGKSAIASSLVSILQEKSRLGSSFAFERGNVALSDPASFWRTVAFDLARRDPVIADKVINNLKEGKVDPGRADISLHFKYLIQDPLTESWKAHMGLDNNFIDADEDAREVREKWVTRLPVVVLDALDECGRDDGSRTVQRQIFLNTLTSWSQLNPSFKLLITSRDDGITQSFRDVCRHIILETGDLASPETNSDIQIFFEQRFADIASLHPSLPSHWPGVQIIKQLTEHAAGLFIWAETVVRFLEEDFPEDCLELILEGGFREKGDVLDRLYGQILQLSFKNPTDRVLDTFRRVVGTIALAKTPLHRADLPYFLGIQERDSSIDAILRKLSSVISNTDGRLRISHLSFTEFMCDSKRCDAAFAIHCDSHNRTMTLACFRTMKEQLRFNICQLETSHIRNTDIPDLAVRVREQISTRLSYSCQFWADHLEATAFDAKILNEAKEFLYIRFLYWLEVLSLIETVRIASQALPILHEWSKTHQGITEFSIHAHDFVVAFGIVILQSAPHIYISALPSAPMQSLVSKVYLPQFPQTISFEIGKANNWPPIRNIFEGHMGQVTSVAFSPDGNSIVSGSFDNTIRIWDVKTGCIISTFTGHTASIVYVVFSPDGKYVISSSRGGTILVSDSVTGDVVPEPFVGHSDFFAISNDGGRIISGAENITVRDVQTGAIISGPFEGHRCSWVRFAFLPDGKVIAAGTSDFCTIRVWDVETGKIICTFEEHLTSINLFVFRLDGKRIVSSSIDKTMLVWNAETGDILSGPFRGYSSSPTCAVFSSDGKYIVSGHDRTLIVWNAETGNIISRPIVGHTSSVKSLSFSPDGQCIVSGSLDGTVRVWNAKPDDKVYSTFEGPTDGIMSLCVSPDGKSIVSGSYNKTILVWNAETGAMISGPFEGHTAAIQSVAFSPDGKHILSGSSDETILVWNAATGSIVSGPFEGLTLWICAVAYSPDGKRIVSGSFDKTILVWDIETADATGGYKVLQGHTVAVSSIAFSPDGKRILSGSCDQTIRVWDAETGDMISGPFDTLAGKVRCVAFSPDGTRIVSGGSKVQVWDAETGDIISGPFEGYAESVLCVAFSPDGHRIVCGSSEQTIRLWDADTGNLLHEPFEGHTSAVTCVAFSPDGKRVISGSLDHTIRVWDVETTSNVFEPFTGGKMEDGWILGSKSELLLWVPPHNRAGLWRARNTVVISKQQTKLDLGKFVHGTSWQQCHTPGTTSRGSSGWIENKLWYLVKYFSYLIS